MGFYTEALAPTITTTTLPNGSLGTPYNQTLTATGTTPITWSQTGGDLPNGLTLSTNGVISGTPTTAGTFSFTAKATNSAGSNSKTLSITIAIPPVITTNDLPSGTTGTSYNQTLAVTGTTPITWSVSSGSLPNGLTLSASSGVISGNPTTAGTFNFTVKATNSAGSDTKALSIIIYAPPVITTTSLPNGGTGVAYNQTLTATGTTPITWSIASGDLPNGLNLSENGVISGTPTAAGTFNFTVKATNSVGNNTKALSIKILTPPVITTTTLPNGTKGTTYNQTLAATGEAITWSKESGNLPNGLNLSASGVISGTPTTSGTFNFTVKVTNIAGSATKALSITIVAPPIITTTTLPDGIIGKEYNKTLAADGDTPITWTIESGNIPTGLAFSANGVITGTPTTAGTFNFTVKATNNAGFATKALSIMIVTPPAITTNNLPNGTIGTAYNQTLTADGDTPIIWSIESGTLPTGLALSTNGMIIGTPKTAGMFNFTVKATNNAGIDTKALPVSIDNVGISENYTTKNVKIYPNPAYDKFVVELDGTATIILYNILGEEILTQSVNEKTEINISHLPTGVYTVSVLSDDKVIGNSKIVKQ
jgi:hypothetical protein